jgi:hypothetical protein
MGSFVIVFLSPVLNNAPGFLDRPKPPAVQAAFAKAPVKALVMPVLPRTSRDNKASLTMLRAQPSRDLLRHKLGTIITLHLSRGTTLDNQPLEPWTTSPAVIDRTVNGQALTGIRIEHC